MATVFNFGWAANQVCHMAMVPEISPDPQERCVLSSRRYSFTIVANVSVFMSFLCILNYVPPVQVANAEKFTILGIICTPSLMVV